MRSPLWEVGYVPPVRCERETTHGYATPWFGAQCGTRYDRYTYDKEKRHALDTWGRHLDALIGVESLGRVVPFLR